MINVAFIKNNIAMDILVFDDTKDNTELIASLVESNGYDTAIELDNLDTPRYSTWDGKKFIATYQKVLGELGVINYVEGDNQIHEPTGE
jgi:CheY-like chemotaxis protein